MQRCARTKRSRLRPVGREAAALHRQCILVDGHNDYFILRHVRGLPFAFMARHPQYHSDGVRLRQGGMTVSCCMVGGHCTDRSFALIELARREIEAHPDDLLLVTRARDILRAKRTGRQGILLSWESGTAMQGRIEILQAAYRLGVRMSTLTHNEGGIPHALQGTPSPMRLYCTAADRDTFRRTAVGLTAFGRAVVREMDRLGMVIDIAHANDAAIEELFALSARPLISSHGGAFGVCPHCRCSTDAQIRALAASGGLLSIAFYDKFLASPGTRATVETIVDHISYVADLVGVDHVGIGSDFDGLPDGLWPVIRTAERLPRLTEALLGRGLSAAEIRKIWGGNYLRVLRAVIG